MDGRTLQQQQQQQQQKQSDVLYSPSAFYRMAPADTVLRSPWSAPALKHSPHYGRRNRKHSHTRSYSSSNGMDYDDEYLDRQLSPSNYDFTYSGMRDYYPYYGQEHQDYRNVAHGLDTQSSLQRSRMHTQQYQQQRNPHNVERPYSRHRRTSFSSYTNRHPFSAPSSNYNMNNFDRFVATDNSGVDPSHYGMHNVDQGKRKPRQQQTAPIVSTSADSNKTSSYRRQEPVNLGHHHHHHHATHSGWKVSGQYNQSSRRSSLSRTPPSLYDNNSSSSTTYTTPSSSSSAPSMPLNKHRYSKSSNKNGVIEKYPSIDGSKQNMSHLHQQKQPILVSSSRTNTSSSASASSLGSSNHYYHTIPVKHSSSTNSINDRYQHSYGDCHDNHQQSRCQNEQTVRARRYSQDDSSYVKQQQMTTPFSVANQSTAHATVPRRASTPKLRRVCSAKPYMEQPLPRNGGNGNSFMDNDDDLLASTMDAASLSLAKITMATAGTADNGNTDGGDLNIMEQQASPTFWNPRSEKDIISVKQTLSRRLRGLLLPQRNKLDAAVSHEQQLAIDYQWSLARPLTPVNELSFDNDAILEDQENGVVDNPFYIINQSWNIGDHIGLSFDENDLLPVDTYVTGIQQMHLSLTPAALSQQILTRPYRRDLHRLRALFTWIIRNITIVDQQKQHGNNNNSDHNNDIDDATTIAATTTTASTGSTTTVTTIQPSKVSFRQRLTTRRNTLATDQEEELEMPAMDVMQGGGLLPEGGGNVDSFDDWLFSESAQQVLLRRECSSSIGMANLFCEMAISAGYHDARVVYGYLRAPKDSIDTARINYGNYTNDEIIADMDDSDNVILIQNHAWCQIKVEGRYRFVDCWLASPFQPQNKNKVESHWFLTKPSDLIYTHFPQEPVDQCLEPTIHVTTFFALPYVWASYFTHNIKMIRYNPNAFNLVDNQVCHLVFCVDTGATCFAFVEMDPAYGADESTPTATTTMRCLAQSRMVPDEHGSLKRIYKVKAVLPPGYDGGWLKIYAGHSPSSTMNSDGAFTRQDRGIHGPSTSSTTLALPPLALCFRLTAQHTQQLGERLRPFEFVHLHPCRNENFYIREPQCYQLYPSHTYNFFVRGDDMHHKLAIKSPGGRLYKLMYYPQEHTYDGSVKLEEIGKWSLVSLLTHSGDWSVVATWECRT